MIAKAVARCRWLLCLLLLSADVAPGLAQDIDDARERTEAQRRADAQSQGRIDQLDDATREALQAYRAAVWETQQLNVYTGQLQELIDQQSAELRSLSNQLDEVQVTERDIMPLMLRMVDALDRFIIMDAPFRSETRRQRVEDLRAALGDPSVSIADRYQKIMEAYGTESDYGRSIGHERIEIDGRVHEVLRIGRVALYALSLDGRSPLRWDGGQEQWQPIPDHYAGNIRRGLRIARESAAPELLLLPFPAPDDDAPSTDRLRALEAVEAASEASTP